jgi:hypothetical protein
MLRVVVKFLCSVDSNCNDTFVVPLLKTEDPILFEIVDLISSLLNWIRILEG